MSSDGDFLILTHVLDNIVAATSFVDGVDVEEFRDDRLRFYAVTRALEIISEATRRLSPELKDRNPAIPWKDIAGAGNIYRHDNEDVLQLRVWNTVQEALPTLQGIVEAELASFD